MSHWREYVVSLVYDVPLVDSCRSRRAIVNLLSRPTIWCWTLDGLNLTNLTGTTVDKTKVSLYATNILNGGWIFFRQSKHVSVLQRAVSHTGTVLTLTEAASNASNVLTDAGPSESRLGRCAIASLPYTGCQSFYQRMRRWTEFFNEFMV